MKKEILLFLFVFLGYNLSAQNNIVENGGFEDAIDPNCLFMGNGFCPIDNYSNVKAYWNNFPGWTYPIRPGWYCNLNGMIPGVGTSDNICVNWARTGDRIGTGGHSEFLIGELKEKIQKNIYYYTEYYLYMGSQNYIELGLKFYKNHPKQCGTKDDIYSNIESGLSSSVMAPLFLETNKWKKISKYITHFVEYEYIGIGLFNHDEPPLNYQVDDVRILKLNENACPPYWKFQNTEFNTDMLFQASDYITIGENHDNMIVI